MSTSVVLQKVVKRYGDVEVIHGIDLNIDPGEFTVFVGPSGCGKSTLLRMIAGLEGVSGGHIRIGDRDVTEVAPRGRDIAMVFQNYALYPHMRVWDNLAFALKLRREPKLTIKKRVGDVAEVLGLTELTERKPGALSGGQRQRVAMGRAIVRQPRAFLMDEPLSNLDAKLRVGMRASLAQLHARLGVTTVYVTHDQTEAMTLGERVAVLRDGAVVQVDRPQELYAHPRDVFVAAFIGAPSMNLVHATVEEAAVRIGQYVLPLDASCRPDTVGPVVVGIRPEAFTDAADAPPDLPRIDVGVEVVEELGADTHVCFWVDARRPEVEVGTAEEDDGALLADQRTLFVARVDPRSAPRPGTRRTLAVDTARLHFFDAATGTALAARARELEATRATALSVE